MEQFDDDQDSNELEIERYELAKKAQLERDKIGKHLYSETRDSFELLFNDYPTHIVKSISRNWRDENNYNTITLTYGDIIFKNYHEIFIKIYNYGIKYESGGIFADIGSGSGRALFASMLMHNFNRCIGIEILKPVHAISQMVLDDWIKNVSSLHTIEKRSTEIRLYCGDALELDEWKLADVVFAHLTSFDKVLMEAIGSIAIKMRPGSIFISLSQKLPESALFSVLEVGSMEVTWGVATVYIQRRSEVLAPGEYADPRGHMNELLSKWRHKT